MYIEIVEKDEEYLWDEKEKKNISKVREKIGMVFQSYDLFPNMTILNNLLLAPMKVQKRNKEEVKKEAEQLLQSTLESTGFQIDKTETILYGVCADCRK